MGKISLSRLTGCFMLAVVLVCAGCAGRKPNPVQQYQYGDNQKSCEHLQCEISDLQGQLTCKIGECDSTQGKNVALGVTGAILFWPALFFMDLSDADQIELDALRNRYNALVRICQDKNCGFDYKQIAQAKPEEQAQGASDFDDISGGGN